AFGSQISTYDGRNGVESCQGWRYSTSPPLQLPEPYGRQPDTDRLLRTEGSSMLVSLPAWSGHLHSRFAQMFRMVMSVSRALVGRRTVSARGERSLSPACRSGLDRCNPREASW